MVDRTETIADMSIKPRRVRSLSDLRGLYTFSVLLVTACALLILAGSKGPLPYVISLTTGALVVASVKWWPWPAWPLAIMGIIYNANPNLNGITYVLCYAPIVRFVIRNERRKALIYSLVLLLGSVYYTIKTGDVVTLSPGLVFTAVAWLLGFVLSSYDERMKAKEEEALQATAAAKLEAAEFAKEIAREMHDAVAHSMSSVILKSRAAAVRPNLSEESKRDLEEITELSVQALGEMRSLLRLLRGAEDETGRYKDYKVIDIAQEAARIEHFLADQAFETRMVIEGDFEGVDPLVTATFVSCIREASANVIRHASDQKPVMISISADHEQISLAFINTIDAERHSIFPSSGLGLIGIRERIEAIGGSITSHEVGERWLLSFSLPKRIGAQQQGELSHVE